MTATKTPPPSLQTTAGSLARSRSLAGSVAMAMLVATLAACGGGGGDSSMMTPAPVTPDPIVVVPQQPVEPNPVLSVPAPSYTDAKKLSAFNRINTIRSAAGLGLLAQNAQLDQAAQGHSDYQALNFTTGHGQTPGDPGYTGGNPTARASAAGYVPDAGGEIISYDAADDGATNVDGHLATPYHRIPVLHYAVQHVGVGYATRAQSPSFGPLTIVLARRSGASQGAPGVPFLVWPLEGASGVGTTMPGESPNPIPENNGAPAGYTISVQVNEALRTLAVTSFTLVDASGAAVPVKLLQGSTDPFLSSNRFDYFVAILPRSPLARNTAYTATFVGSYANKNGTGVTPINKTWTFTTGANLWGGR